MKYWGLPVGVAWVLPIGIVIALLGSCLFFHPADRSMPDLTNEQVKEADVEFFTKEEIEQIELMEDESARIRNEIEKIREELNQLKELKELKEKQQSQRKFWTV